MEEIRNVIDNRLRNIKHATIPYNEKWKIKKGDNIPVVTYSFTHLLRASHVDIIVMNSIINIQYRLLISYRLTRQKPRLKI